MIIDTRIRKPQKKAVRIRQAKVEDIERIIILEEEVWPEGLRATRSQFLSRIETFPEGVIIAIADDTIVGVVATEIVSYNLSNLGLTWKEITDEGFIRGTHNPNGDTLYGIDLSVSSSGINSSKLLMEQIGRLIIGRNLKRGILGARIPRYFKVADKMSAEEYVNGRRNNRPLDPELIFYTRLGLRIAKVIPDYIT